eukprot:1432622-Pyramimonas_sp.AAC.1
MIIILSKIVLIRVRPKLIKAVTCQECRACDMPGHTGMPSTTLPGKFNAEVECDLMFYRQEHKIFHVIDS